MVTKQERAARALEALDDELSELAFVLDEDDPLELVSRAEDSISTIAEELAELLSFLGATGKATVSRFDLRDLCLGGDALTIRLFGETGPGKLVLDPHGEYEDDRLLIVDDTKNGALAQRWSSLLLGTDPISPGA